MSKNPSFEFDAFQKETSKPQSKIVSILKILRVVFLALTLLFVLLMVTNVVKDLSPVVFSWSAMIISEVILIQVVKKEKEK